jgi:beta-glucosidase
LKNERNILPVSKEKPGSIAMLGLAKGYLGHGGRSTAANSHQKTTAYQPFNEALEGAVGLKYAEGM